ncbi:MAG: DUF4167 domain-containing protein [Acetobacteraceae bacterium]|nr:DUF4167 domain-containing protein [Acetobacteraceae bacterium]
MNLKRMRGRSGGRNIRHHGGGGGGGHHGGIPLNRNHVFDSNGPEVRVRGTAQQLFEKYLQLGRDATSAGDRVMAESCFQHAEHYFRILNAMNQAAAAQQQQHQQRQQLRNGYDPEQPDMGAEGAGPENGANGHQIDPHGTEDEPRAGTAD